MLGDAIAMELSYGSPFGDAYEGLVAHEYFHRWNGGIIEAGCKNEMECYWLQEGATSYLADIVVSNQYVDNIDKFLEYLGSRIEAHTNNNMKGADQSKIRRCFWNDNACYNLIYDRGYLLSWMLDYELRIRSKGNKTLIGYLRYLVELAENGAYVYDNDRLLNSINDYSTSEFRSFWKKYVLSNEALPVNDYLDKCNVVIKGSVAGEANSERSYSSSVEVSDGRPRSEKWKHRYDFDAGGVADGVTIMDILALMDSR